MKYNFSYCLAWVLKHEGGFVNHPEDPGGMTNMGITAQTYAEYTGRRLSTITEREMRSLTIEQVSPIYKRKYWDKCKCDQLPSGIDYAVFDYAVNSGPSRAIKHLQQCLAIKDDGLIGPQTLKYTLDAVPEELLREYMQRREDFLRGLKTFKTFGRGWMRRVTEVELKAQELVGLSLAPVITKSSTIDDETRQRALEWAAKQP
jgi:lysozyme family protein